MKKKKIRNRKGSFMVEPKDYRCSLSKLGLERKNDYLVAVTMRDKDAPERSRVLCFIQMLPVFC